MPEDLMLVCSISCFEEYNVIVTRTNVVRNSVLLQYLVQRNYCIGNIKERVCAAFGPGKACVLFMLLTTSESSLKIYCPCFLIKGQ